MNSKIIEPVAETKFVVNENIVLKLEDGKTNIYIGGKLIRQCKHIILLNPTQNELQGEIQSVDDLNSIKDRSQEPDLKELGITPEIAFWGHCSNIQIWAENDYDTRLIHSNLAFPLLKKLAKIGDPIAKKLYKNEIAERFMEGSDETRKIIIQEGFLNYLDRNEFWSLFEEGSIMEKIENIINQEAFFEFIEDKTVQLSDYSEDFRRHLLFRIKDNFVFRIAFIRLNKRTSPKLQNIDTLIWKKVFKELANLKKLDIIWLIECNIDVKEVVYKLDEKMKRKIDLSQSSSTYEITSFDGEYNFLKKKI